MKYSLALLAFVVTVGWGQSYEKRLALVIGNGNYQNGGALKNPVNDARAIGTALKDLGFEVMKFENVSQTQLKQAINSFGIKLKEFDVGLFYYAGHGIQYKGFNYMIPVEADLQAAEQIEFDCVAADRVLAFMDAASAKVKVIIMDACRNNPFERSWNRSTAGNGLALMNAPTGSLIAYATAPGRVASDGESSNGLYTSALLKYMKDPGLNIEQVFKRVRTEVSDKSFGAQVPWETTSLTGGDFYFATHEAHAVVSTEKEVVGGGSAGASRSTIPPEKRAKALKYYKDANTKYDAKAYAEAAAEYTKALEINPDYVDALTWRGHAMYGLAKYEEAIADYDKSLKLKPDDAQVFYYRGYSKYNLQHEDEAVEDFTEAIRLNGTDANSFYMRGESYYALEMFPEAEADYSRTIDLQPNYSSAYYMRGNARYSKGLPGSVEDFNKCIELSPDYAEAYFMRGSCSYIAKLYAPAEKDYSLAVTKKPDYAEAYYWRANARLNLGRKKEAQADIEKAVELDPGNTTYLQFQKNNFN